MKNRFLLKPKYFILFILIAIQIIAIFTSIYVQNDNIKTISMYIVVFATLAIMIDSSLFIGFNRKVGERENGIALSIQLLMFALTFIVSILCAAYIQDEKLMYIVSNFIAAFSLLAALAALGKAAIDNIQAKKDTNNTLKAVLISTKIDIYDDLLNRINKIYLKPHYQFVEIYKKPRFLSVFEPGESFSLKLLNSFPKSHAICKGLHISITNFYLEIESISAIAFAIRDRAEKTMQKDRLALLTLNDNLSKIDSLRIVDSIDQLNLCSSIPEIQNLIKELIESYKKYQMFANNIIDFKAGLFKIMKLELTNSFPTIDDVKF